MLSCRMSLICVTRKTSFNSYCTTLFPKKCDAFDKVCAKTKFCPTCTCDKIARSRPKKGPTGKHKDAERILFISGLSACYDHRSTIVGMSASPFHDQRAEPIIAAHRYGNMARAGQCTAREPTPSFRFRVGAFSSALTHTQVYAKRMERDV